MIESFLNRRQALACAAASAVAPLLPAADVLFPKELKEFRQHGAAPVFSAGAPGAWDAAIRERGWILHENGVWRLWYTGYDGTKTGRRMLGLATSTDGVAWVRHPANPIVRDAWVEDVMIARDGDRLLMVAEGEGDRAHLLASTDGVNWKKLGTLDIRQANGQPIPDGPFGTPVLWRDANRWCLFYERMDKAVWLAVSTDLKTWRHVSDTPVLKPGPGEHDHDMIAMNQVFQHAGKYFASYHGTNTSGPLPRKWSSCLAVSTDLVNWTKYEKPLFPPADNKSSGVFVPVGAGFRLYTMHPQVVLHEPSR